MSEALTDALTILTGLRDSHPATDTNQDRYEHDLSEGLRKGTENHNEKLAGPFLFMAPCVLSKENTRLIHINRLYRGVSSMHTILRLSDVKKRTGLSRSTIYLRISQGNFPKPISLGGRAVGWLEAEIQEWLQRLIEASRKPAA
jgi:prophage regulatory protein